MEGTVKIPGGYFLKMAKHDYHNYHEALPREFYQNSIDAEATVITVATDRKHRAVRVIDDGCGMSLDTIKNKLLVLGGSYKKDGNAAGVFGKAKELLFFSWGSYEIRTREWIILGEGAHFKINKSGEYVNGTDCLIRFQDDEWSTWEAAFTRVARKMDTETRFIIDGKELFVKELRGEFKKDLGWAKIYQRDDVQNSRAQVKLNGIWMFDYYLGEGYGKIVIDLSRSSLECLTSNRDGLTWEYSSKLQSFVKKLMVDKRSALREEPKSVYEKMVGDGLIKLDVSMIAHRMFQDVDQSLWSTQAGMTAMKMFGDMGVKVDEIAAQRIQDISFKRDSRNVVVSKLAFIGYKSDFILKHQKQESVERYMSASRAELAAKLWTEVLKQVLLDNGRFIEFIAGFSFSSDQDAEHEKHNGVHYFFLNPVNLGSAYGGRAGMKSRKVIVKDLIQRAVHEIAHMKCPHHDEDFVMELHRIEARTWGSGKAFSVIRRIQV